MASKTRLANKTIWALEDIVALCREGRGDWQDAMDRAERKIDPVMMLALARLRDRLAEIERLAGDARRGKYDTRVQEWGNGEYDTGRRFLDAAARRSE